jgi:predicted metalloprotease
MRWTRGGKSRNVEDRRAETGLGGGRLRGAPRIGGGGLLILLLLAFFFRQDLLSILASGPGNPQVSAPNRSWPQQRAPAPSAPPGSAGEDELVQFVSFVLDDLQSTWRQLLPRYQDTKLVLFRDAIRSSCGFAQAATGPFDCPLDGKVYIDLGFYDELRRRFGAPGDFAQAYVLAHEVGHHILLEAARGVASARPRERRPRRLRYVRQPGALTDRPSLEQGRDPSLGDIAGRHRLSRHRF